MDDLDLKQLLRPLARSWAWVLLVGGGLAAYGVLMLITAVTVAVMGLSFSSASFHIFFYVPIGILAILTGWQLVSIARTFASDLSSGAPHSVGLLVRKLRLAFIYAGAMSLLFLFLLFLGFVATRIW